MSASSRPRRLPSPTTKPGQFNDWCLRCSRYAPHWLRKEPAAATFGQCVLCKLVHISR